MELWTTVLAVASAIVLLSNAAEKIGKAIQIAKAPNVQQDKKIEELQEWRKGADVKFDNDHRRIEGLESGNRATQRAILALLDHGIDGNNIQQMQNAKEELQNHLINR